ncbi:hypothetical protein QMT40_002851 [Parvibaculaceae bacterium PLY_AMNH_Bact1]|nr:hypothetical protein QMT40_002851 [Parvibaculaceae bacterium PLY_AMNH_Bact1]
MKDKGQIRPEDFQKLERDWAASDFDSVDAYLESLTEEERQEIIEKLGEAES